MISQTKLAISKGYSGFKTPSLLNKPLQGRNSLLVMIAIRNTLSSWATTLNQPLTFAQLH